MDIRTPGPVSISLAVRFALTACLAVLAVNLVPPRCHAQWIDPADIEGPLLDGEPFDLVYLNKEAKGAVLKVLPLTEPLPNPLPIEGGLIVEYFDGSSDLLRVPFTSVASLKTFNDLLLEEAEIWIKDDEQSMAFRNLLFVYDHGGKDNSQLVSTLNTCLFQDAKNKFQSNQFEMALAIFEELYRDDPNMKVKGIDQDLIDIVLLCYGGIIEKQFESGEYGQVQKTLEAAEKKYQNSAAKLATQWKAQFVEKARELMEEARSLAAAGKGRESHLAARQAEQMAPQLAEVKTLQEEILKKFPLLVVGVSQQGTEPDPTRIDHWGDRRVGRFTKRTIIELAGLSDEGGKYIFPNGEFYRIDELGLQYVFEFKDETPFATPPADAFHIASRVLDVADPNSPDFDERLAKIIKSVSIESDTRILIQLRSAFVLPEALLTIPYADPNLRGTSAEQVDGIYVRTDANENSATFELNPLFEPLPQRQHPVIIEELFADASRAADALLKRNIDMVDRISLADLSRLKSQPGIVVRPYVLPTVHLLIPKIRGELTNDNQFRNGLSYAIDRESIVKNVFSGGEEIDGCEVLSGPFPIGTEDNDQIAYGYDLKVRPLLFNSDLAMVLIEMAISKNDKRLRLPSPKLKIVHSNSSSAALGAEAIARMWTDVGVETSTEALPVGETVPNHDRWDFLYLETTMEEPLADASTIIGQTGFATDVSAPVEQTLQTLSYSENWRAACSALRRLHRQVSVDLSVIPLWQIKEHYAYRNTVRGVGRDLIHLYQNVDLWQIDTYGTDEKE